MKKRSYLHLPAHPFLLAVVPALSLLGGNIVEITFKETLRSLAGFLGGALAVFLLLWLLTRSAQRAGLAASYMLVLFSTFGEAHLRLKGALGEGSPLAMANVLAALWAAALIVGVWALLRLLRDPLPLTVIANAAALGALAAAVYPLGAYAARGALEGPVTVRRPVEIQSTLPAAVHKPDIYYIILDGYGRSDALAAFHNSDDSAFLAFLESRGFVVADQSSTNYARTMLSLSSSLNYSYLDELIEARPEANNYDAYRALIKDNAVMRFLQGQGYRTAALATGFEITEVSGADVFLSSQKMSYFEETLLARTMAIFWVDQVVGDFRRDELRGAFANLESTVDLPGPKFVFAHIMAPHPPFVFDENGGPLAPRGWGDGSSYAGGVEHYLENYRRQQQYVDRVMTGLVQRIQDGSDEPPVIIIQGDHGPGAYVDWMDWRSTCLLERMPILNAYALPGVDPAEIPADISPVNTFRLVFNHYFGAQLPLLENRGYMAHLPRPYEYIDVTGQAGSCPTP